MKLRTNLLAGMRWALTAGVTLALAGGAFAQSGDDEIPKAAAMAGIAGIMIFILLFVAAVYVYVALALQTIANKTKTENSWLAWIPIANIVLMLNVAKKPIWWIVLCLIPFVNIVIMVLVWMAIAEARNKPSFWGILMIVPVVSLIVPGYLAWSD